jgi:hypothetical protein
VSIRRLALLSLFIALAAFPAAAQSLDWSAPGSAAMIDPQLGLWTFSGAALQIKPTAIATVEARFPVTNTYGSAFSLMPAWGTMKMTFVDNHAGAAVSAELMEVDACSATERQLCSISSSDGDSSVRCDTCSWVTGVDFSTHSYYIHVTVAKTDTPATPALYSVALY